MYNVYNVLTTKYTVLSLKKSMHIHLLGHTFTFVGIQHYSECYTSSATSEHLFVCLESSVGVLLRAAVGGPLWSPFGNLLGSTVCVLMGPAVV